MVRDLECDLERGVMKMAKLKKMLTHLGKNESGQGALAIVLILLMLGAIILTPLLVFMSTGLKAGGVYESKVQEFYAADAGVEDALWQIKYDHLDEKFTSPAYDPYDYDTNYTYDLPDEINNENVTVNITNVWIPTADAPDPDDALEIIESGRLIVTGSVITFSGGQRGYEIKISYSYNTTVGSPYYDPNGENLWVDDIGVWLFGGFDYVDSGSGSLDNYTFSKASHCGGKAIVWDVDTALKDLPGGMGYPLVRAFDFQFTGPVDQNPQAVSWITTTGVAAVPLSWDADSKPYRIESTAGSTTAEAYVIKNELRKLGAAMSGDYRAVGNSLMIDTNSDDKRDKLLNETSATVSDIPASAYVEAAYLYWSGWFKEGVAIFSDSCSNFDKWDRSASGSRWTLSSGRFQGQGSSTATLAQKTLTMKNSLDLSSYTPGAVTVFWDQSKGGTLESGDTLYYAFYNGTSWSTDFVAFSGNSPSSSFSTTIPDAYLTNNFKMRFYFNFDNSHEYVYLDNIKIVQADATCIFKINGTQVYFDGDGNPQKGAQPITADTSQALPNYKSSGTPNGFSYACFKDVTKLVRMCTDDGNAGYTIGGVDATWNASNEWAYAGWSLIIVYSSPETKGHQLYLYDDFAYADMDSNVDFDNDGQPGGTISGFLVPYPVEDEENAATITVFVGEGDECYDYDYFKFKGTALSDGYTTHNVWNSKSVGMTYDGVDIDTFYVTWASGLLEPGDTSAQIDLPTKTDSWNLVYIILSFRSEITIGGTISYLIRG